MPAAKKKTQQGKPPRDSKRGLKCETKFCRSLKPRRNDGYLSRVCWKCKSRELKQKHEATYVLNAIRQRAKKRGVPFSLTLAQFRLWCQETGYLQTRGRGAKSMSIDRINHDRGYHIDNIQIAPFLANSQAGHTVPGYHTQQNARGDYREDWDAQEGSTDPDAASKENNSETEPF